MLLHLPGILSTEALAEIHDGLAGLTWVDGRVTAGSQSREVKNNLQLEEGSAATRALGDLVLKALEGSKKFWSAALPSRVYPPSFSRYEPGMGFGSHIDNAFRKVPGARGWMRVDVSATLFLSPPYSYDGGELVVEGSFGTQTVKLPAGDLALYPATSRHHVRPVTRGVRLASFFWAQSRVKDDAERNLLYELDQSAKALAARHGGNDAEVLRLSGIYNNLLRKWGAP